MSDLVYQVQQFKFYSVPRKRHKIVLKSKVIRFHLQMGDDGVSLVKMEKTNILLGLFLR